MLSGKDADGFSAIALAIFTRRSVRRRSPNSAVPNVSTAHFSGCSSPAMSICFAPFVYIASPSSLPEFVLTCQVPVVALADCVGEQNSPWWPWLPLDRMACHSYQCQESDRCPDSHADRRSCALDRSHQELAASG